MEYMSDHGAFIAGLAAAIVAAWAWYGDHRRMRRTHPDKVGFMPWTTLFFWSLLAAVLLLGTAVKEWFSGS